ncbi:alanine racemase [Salinibacterium hongtaonis]|uniref:Alanine racemase n=1 Tax=Homoserinimonas hongtaonis TaxID=2079791 RepID=A0A2U1T051_9MICO|nr:alanine racemase [Salinibacterium hongtaonis]PWB97236.1 alanine racemase [Salinibacterium hongtaonis]
MSITLGVGAEHWHTTSAYWESLNQATADLDPPFGTVSLAALAHNADAMVRRAGGTPIRVASKSVRVRAVLEAVLARPGYRGVLAYTLAEALWLAQTIDDVVVGYPTVDRSALRQLAADPLLASRVTLMVDSVAHLDFIDSVLGPSQRARLRLCLELDASWNSRLLGHIGTWRSPVYTAAAARKLARLIVDRPGFELVGMMAYEGQIAGMGDQPVGRPLYGAALRRIQAQSMAELAERRAEAVAGVREVADLEFVNGGGTGSLESTAAEAAVTEVAAGSGLFGPHLFDHYSRFSPAPAAAFALPVVRRPTAHTATLLGGGWIASGPPGVDRLPRIAWPSGLRMVSREMAGEVQTPVVGAAAENLAIGDRVWLRHTKAGELSEHLNEFAIVDNGTIVDTVPTYRGEGAAFL